MPCTKCGGGVRMSVNSFSAPPQTNAWGVYPLQDYPDCTSPYNGVYRAGSAYVVGYGTSYEKVFRKTQRNEVLDYQATADPAGRLSLFQAPLTRLCSAAVVDLYGK